MPKSQALAKKLVAFVVIAVLYLMARQPSIDDADRRQLAAGLGFSTAVLPVVDGPEVRGVRPVHPSLQHIAGWISAVGAAVALGDVDGDGAPNDVCYVDTATDQVIVAPVPDVPRVASYAAFVLDPGSEHFDRSTMAPMGCLAGDFNEDGLTDLLVYYWGRTPIAFLRAAGAPLATAAFDVCPLVEPDERWFTNAATQADVDGDGHLDLVFGNYFQDGARILDAEATGSESMQRSMSRATNAGTNRLLLWSGAESGPAAGVRYDDVPGVFDVGDEDVATAWTLAVAAADLDGDLLPEIYFSNDFGSDRLLHNRSRPGAPRFALATGRRAWDSPRSKTIGHDSFKGMGADFGDLNGDGHLDLYVSNIAAEYALEESHFVFVNGGRPDLLAAGVAVFDEQSEALGLARSSWGWDARLVDFDNDGVLEAMQATGFVKGSINRWPELHEVAMGNDELLRFPGNWHRFGPDDDLSGHDHNPLFARAADGRYYDVAPLIGMDQPQVTRGIATADVDGDGDVDAAIGNQWERSRFYRNESVAGDFLGLRLVHAAGELATETTVVGGRPVLTRPTYPAIGATARIEWNGRVLVGQVDGGNGHSGARAPELHFGLGNAGDDMPVVELAWRDPGGLVHETSVELMPGWHTIVLGRSTQAVSSLPATQLVQRHEQEGEVH